MRLIVPVCGDSTRFPGLRPKWLLTHPNGNLMFFEAIRALNLAGVTEVVIICRRDHDEALNLRDVVARQWERGRMELPHQVVVIEPTASQPETVARGIEVLGLEGPILIKDADSQYVAPVKPGNVVATMDLARLPLANAAAKSYVETDDAGRIVNIAEKQVISNTFCAGGYGFQSAAEFRAYFDRLRGQSDLYVSHVVYAMLMDGREFLAQPVPEFADWGTVSDWNRYKRGYATLLIDLDGVIVENSGCYFSPTWGTTMALPGAVSILRRLYESRRVHLIITTSRAEDQADVTREQLRRLGVPYHRLIFGLPHARRILVNDYALSNPYPAAEAVNLPRDSGDLAPLLTELLDLVGDDGA